MIICGSRERFDRINCGRRKANECGQKKKVVRTRCSIMKMFCEWGETRSIGKVTAQVICRLMDRKWMARAISGRFIEFVFSHSTISIADDTRADLYWKKVNWSSFRRRIWIVFFEWNCSIYFSIYFGPRLRENELLIGFLCINVYVDINVKHYRVRSRHVYLELEI